MDVGAMGREHLRDEQPELTVSQHGDGRPARDRDLIEYLASGRQRLGEYGLLRRD